MTTQTTNRKSPWQGQAKADKGDFKTEVPSEDVHEARIVAMIDLGTHRESFQGGPEKDARKMYLVYELDEEMTGMKGVNHVVAQRYTLSFHEKATLRKLAEAILNDGQKFPAEQQIDYGPLLGQPCTVQIVHEKKTTDKGERVYAKIGVVAAVGKKQRDRVFRPKRDLTEWYVGDATSGLPDWLPRIYGEEVKDVIGRCAELKAPRDDEEGEAPAAAEEETPF